MVVPFFRGTVAAGSPSTFAGGFLLPVSFGSADGAILGPVGAGEERLGADGAPLHFLSEQQRGFQALVKR